jgi:hypothetical protein
MNKTKAIFIAFIGKDTKQQNNILAICDGYERWNLKKFTRDNFIETIKTKIQPINNNVLKFYKKEESEGTSYGITEKLFKQSSWGLLIPETLDNYSSYEEIMFLINLYSPNFLYPLFYVNYMGITPIEHNKHHMLYFHQQNHILFNKKFVSFYKILLEQSGYAAWNLDHVKKYDSEDYRLFVSAMLYSGLKDYEYEKSSFGWQRESAEMSTILESLFTAGDNQNEEISYRLRKRMAVLLSKQFPTIENDIKTLYNARSSFVHGSFFAQIAKESAKTESKIPIPDFGLLYKQKEYVRYALAAYLNLAIIIKTEGINDTKSVMDALEQSIINIELRKILNKKTDEIIKLMPKPSFKPLE